MKKCLFLLKTSKPTRTSLFLTNDTLATLTSSLVNKWKIYNIKYQNSYRSHFLTTALLIVSLILDFRMSQILEYSSLYFLASPSNMFALSIHYRRFFSDSLSIIFIWIMQSLAFLFASDTYTRLLYSCWRSECSSCYLSLIDRPTMFSFYEISVLSFDTR